MWQFLLANFFLAPQTFLLVLPTFLLAARVKKILLKNENRIFQV